MYWALRIKTLSNGYHSVYSNKSRALKALLFYTKNIPNTKYFLQEVDPIAKSRNWYNKTQVKFQDSVGWLEVIN